MQEELKGSKNQEQPPGNGFGLVCLSRVLFIHAMENITVSTDRDLREETIDALFESDDPRAKKALRGMVD